MITGFENETRPLDDLEKKLLPSFVNGLKNHIGKIDPVTSKDIIHGIWRTHNVEISGSRVRKMINHVRMNNLVPRLVAKSSGYYVELDNNELSKYIRSLRQRAKAIQAVADALTKQMDPVQKSLFK